MDLGAKLSNILRAVLLQLPSLLTILACLVAAFIRWPRHPRVSLTVIISLVLLGAFTLIFPFLYAFMPEMLGFSGDFLRRQVVFAVISFVYNSLWAVALLVLLIAIFRQRPPQPA
jgi:hypothetical protein